MERARTCCFTGGRPEHIGFDQTDLCRFGALKRDLDGAIRRAAAQGYTDFFCGMSRGFDLWAGEVLLELSDELGLRLHAAIPFPGQTDHWPASDLYLYARILQKCATVTTCSEDFHRGVYHERNRYMVDRSSLVITWNMGRKGGGTDYTCRYARKNNVPIINLADPQISQF